jgi:hypothetical protein
MCHNNHNNQCHVTITWQCCHMATNIFRNLRALISTVHTLEIILRNPYVILLKSPKKQTKQNVQKSNYNKLKTTYLG